MVTIIHFCHPSSLSILSQELTRTLLCSILSFTLVSFSPSDAFPWPAVIAVAIILPLIVLILAIYSIKSGYGCSSWYKDAIDAAKRTELVVAHPNQIGATDGYIGGGGSEKMVTFGNGRRKAPIVNVPTDIDYHRTESKESTETLLSDPKRNASGNSESTSGCESARSSEIGNCELDDEEAEDESMTLNIPSSDNATEITTAAAAAPYSGTAAGYVVAHRGVAEAAVDADAFWSGAAGLPLPPGYSRMSRAWDPPPPPQLSATTPAESRGYVAFSAAPNRPPAPQPPPSQRGYVTFGSAQSGVPQSPAGKPASSPAPPPPAAVKGYITMAEANKMNAFNPGGASERLPEHEPPLSALGYSKVGIGTAPASSGYVSHDELLRKQQLSDCLRQVGGTGHTASPDC